MPSSHSRCVLDDIMQWANESESTRDSFMLWLFGPAGAGKSAIAKRMAEIAAERGLLIASFFFSRTSPSRGTKDRLIATLAYQLALSIPRTRSYIEDAIEQDPVIFNKTVQTQIDALLIKPFQSISENQVVPSQKLIVIDGLDECHDRKNQVAILEAISRSFPQHNLPIKFLLVSRPETDLVTSFDCKEPLKFIHRRLSLDNNYRPDDDIRLFFSDKFEHIRLTHPLKSTIPVLWPAQEALQVLVAKSSGQFIYASTVVKFVESSRHRPTARLNIILGISPPGTLNPFAELDALFNHLLSSVDDVHLTLRVLSLYVMTPRLTPTLYEVSISPELFLSLELGDIQLALMDLSSILTYHEPSGRVEVLHASLVDFLSDRHRSTTFYIDMASTYTDFVFRILQYVKAPDGIRAGDIHLFYGIITLSPWILKGRLQSDILDFDFDAFINASIKWQYNDNQHISPTNMTGYTIEAFKIWRQLLTDAGLEDRVKSDALHRLHKSFRPRLRAYQSDWRLQLLLTFKQAATTVWYYWSPEVPSCRCVDILLGMDDHDLHLVDQHALDLRHGYIIYGPKLALDSHLDGVPYASAALHCMRFLSSPPKYSERNESPEMGLIYIEWKAACEMTLELLRKLLQQASASPELVGFVSNHDIHPTIRNDLSADRSVWEVDMHILAFLSRASICSNWRITSAIQRSLITTHQQPSNDAKSNAYEERQANLHLMRPRLDPCCSNAH